MEISPFVIRGKIRNSAENNVNELVKKVIFGDKESIIVLINKSKEE